MTYLNHTITSILFMTLNLLACKNANIDTTIMATEENEADGSEWNYLFDGTSLTGWRGYNEEKLPLSWLIEEGALKTLGTGGDQGGDIIYGAAKFDNFELSLEWKLTPGGNSGIFYHVVEGTQYHSPYQTGPEYQLIDDDGFGGALEDWQKAACDYAMYTADPVVKKVVPPGEWNTSKIVFTSEKVEHWLNGVKVLEFVPWSEDWENRKMSGKWKDFPDYGLAKTGYIGLQDHGSPCWFRNIKIKKL